MPLIGMVPPPTNATTDPSTPKIRRHPACPESAAYVGISSAAQHPVGVAAVAALPFSSTCTDGAVTCPIALHQVRNLRQP